MKSHFVISSLIALVLMVQGATSAPIPNPKPIEDIYPTQFPDPNLFASTASADNSAFLTLLASSFNINDNSAMNSTPKKG
ncbi:uncharacterized protein UTRI_03808_B [Ustilago trichophora]|uniref:Uncharacterized protein n=1 Tax=Ustilago trichophora TaxID=86804 RepID=A0A5C3DZZ0_9BASI|nr:uncharacterized protein UTRI_03808_B [Ustilago trichophora]